MGRRCLAEASMELGKVSVGIEVENSLASALRMKLSDLVRRAEWRYPRPIVI